MQIKKLVFIMTRWVLTWWIVNPFIANALFLYFPKASENRKVFWYLQWVEKGWIGNEWVNLILSFSTISMLFTLLLKKKVLYQRNLLKKSGTSWGSSQLIFIKRTDCFSVLSSYSSFHKLFKKISNSTWLGSIQ